MMMDEWIIRTTIRKRTSKSFRDQTGRHRRRSEGATFYDALGPLRTSYLFRSNILIETFTRAAQFEAIPICTSAIYH